MLEWFAKHSARTNLHVYRDQLLSEYLPATHDYLATAVIGGKEFLGRGADVNETLALQAAFGELVERATLTSSDNQEIRITSNGIAAHSTFQKARDAAIAELVERDSF